MTRIVLVGAGSVEFTRNLLGDFLSYPELRDATIVLHDIDAGAARDGPADGRWTAAAMGAEPAHRGSTSTAGGPAGADIVVDTIQVGGARATQVDFDVPARYGLRYTINDTINVGGVIRGLRSIPVVLDIVRDMEDLCPDAWFLNYTNPMAMLDPRRRVADRHQTVGLCHSVFWTIDTLARVPGRAARTEVDTFTAGVNHLAFVLRLEHHGRDLYPDLAAFCASGRVPDDDLVRAELFRRLGRYPTESSEHHAEYNPWFIPKGDLVERLHIPIGEYLDRVATQPRRVRGDRSASSTRASRSRSSAAASTPRSSPTRADRRADADRGQRHQRWRPDLRTCRGRLRRGARPGRRAGVHPVAVGALPLQLAAYVGPAVDTQALTVQAALDEDREAIYHAVMQDPQAQARLTLDEVWRMTDELIEGEGRVAARLAGRWSKELMAGAPLSAERLGAPLYRRIQAELRDDVARGRLAPGSRLPSEPELMARFGVSRATVRQALGGLTAEGLLEIRRGLGTYVREPRFEHTLGGFYSYSREIERHGRVPGTRVLDLRVIAADEGLADALAIADGAEVVALQRLRLAGEEPLVVETSFLPAARFPGLEDVDFRRVRLYDTLVARFGVRPVRAREVFEPVLLTAEEAAVLDGRRGDRCAAGGTHRLRWRRHDRGVLPQHGAGRSVSLRRGAARPVSAELRPSGDLDRAIERTIAWQEASTGGVALDAAVRVAREAPERVLDPLRSATRLIVTGAGSSYYLAQSAAAALRLVAGLPAVAAPLSEMLLRPAVVLARGSVAQQVVVVISRSGSTTEAVAVAEASRGRGQPTVAVTCRPASPMATAADAVLASPLGDEAAIVMTRSFVSMLGLLLRVAARLGGDAVLAADLDSAASRWREATALVEPALALAAADPTRVAVLGGGVAYGLANEVVLKITEMSQLPAAAWEPLEFRHGPMSICEPGVLVVGLLGGDGAAEEGRVLDESAALGATTWQLGLDSPAADLHPLARLPLLLHPLQALAVGVALRRGLDPDRPRHLGQVVRHQRGSIDAASRLPSAHPPPAHGP